MDKVRRKTQLVYENKSEEVYSTCVDDLFKRVDTYFRIKPNRFFLSYKGLVLLYEVPLEDTSKLNKIEQKLEDQKIERNNNFEKFLIIALNDENDKALKIKVLTNKKRFTKEAKDEHKDSDSDEDDNKETDAEESKGKF
jgi:hypothetical protein